MPLELSKQVTSRELSEMLKTLGVKQDSYFHWVYRKGYWSVWNATDDSDYSTGVEQDRLAAFTASELGEMLPEELYFYKSGTLWNVLSLEGSKIADNLPLTFGHGDIAEDNLAEAMGKMLEYLINKKIIKP